MALQSAHNATVIGSTTAGTDGNISKIPLPGGIATSFSGIGVYYPDKTETQHMGVKINIPVKQTLKGFQEGRDELLEKAIEIVRTGT
jgi:C-terminal processing protease CtpA/Prc